MSKGPLLTSLVAVLSLGTVLGAFLSSANPYVDSVAAAKVSRDESMHLAGDIVKGTVKQDFKTGALTFQLRDAKGERILVEHHGEPPANMGDATKVVAVGAVRDGIFESKQLLIKCPSKYEGEKKQG